MATNSQTPAWQNPVVDPGTGVASQVWFSFFALLGGQPGPIVPVQIGAGPFTFTASQSGSLAISGGTVSSVTLARARVSGVPTGVANGVVPMANGDSVTITYSAAPTLNFIPS